jgi:hypothetical protein
MNWPKTAEITGGILAGLFFVPLTIVTVRTILEGRAGPWIPATDISEAMARDAAEGWFHRSLTAFDIAFNVIVLRGQQDETISTHTYRAFLEGKFWGKYMNKWLCWFQPNHGPLATTGDYYRAMVRVAVLKKVLGVIS